MQVYFAQWWLGLDINTLITTSLSVLIVQGTWPCQRNLETISVSHISFKRFSRFLTVFKGSHMRFRKNASILSTHDIKLFNIIRVSPRGHLAVNQGVSPSHPQRHLNEWRTTRRHPWLPTSIVPRHDIFLSHNPETDESTRPQGQVLSARGRAKVNATGPDPAPPPLWVEVWPDWSTRSCPTEGYCATAWKAHRGRTRQWLKISIALRHKTAPAGANSALCTRKKRWKQCINRIM